jgi:hypothetical protein
MTVLILISSFGFLFYGIECLKSKKMVAEFERFGCSQYRIITGVLEILGAIGLAIGWFVPYLTALSAAVLATLMFLGILVRLKVGDSLLACTPAFILFVVNLLITIQYSNH